ncbi:MAG: hypothetical protein J6Y94_08060 [Bacteriovoracaceae bacterium]|nr:hypothetical protein [Bacteriovoracaceae bacterium]
MGIRVGTLPQNPWQPTFMGTLLKAFKTTLGTGLSVLGQLLPLLLLLIVMRDLPSSYPTSCILLVTAKANTLPVYTTASIRRRPWPRPPLKKAIFRRPNG